jgi:DNA primase
MYEFINTIYKLPSLTEIDNSVLNASIFQTDVLSIWEQEGITLPTMKKYKIGYDPINNCITIPIYDHQGQLVSVRGRFLSENETVKYRPIVFCNKILSVPSSQILYGFYQNQDFIKESKKAIIFESEKSVLMMDSYYGNKNNSVATLGKNISNQQIMLLKTLRTEEVILAYDADYATEAEFNKKYKEYVKIAQTLAPFFTVSIIMDWDKLLRFKDSPIDRGRNIFEKLLEKRTYVKL